MKAQIEYRYDAAHPAYVEPAHEAEVRGVSLQQHINDLLIGRYLARHGLGTLHDLLWLLDFPFRTLSATNSLLYFSPDFATLIRPFQVTWRLDTVVEEIRREQSSLLQATLTLQPQKGSRWIVLLLPHAPSAHRFWATTWYHPSAGSGHG